MQPLTVGTFLIESLLFFLALIFFFYLPGQWMLKRLRLKLDAPEHVSLSTVLGIVCFTLASYLTAWINIRYLVLLPILFIAYDSFKKKIHRPHFDIPILHVGIILMLAIMFSLPQTITGIWGNTFSYGGDDTIHLAYINELKAHFPPDHPGFAGTQIKGYHFFLNFLIANISLLTGISNESLFYHYLPLLTGLLIGLGVYSLITVWTKNNIAGLWGTFLVLAGGSFGFILSLQGHINISISSVFGINQPGTAILNAPFAFSLVLVAAALTLLLHYSQSKNMRWLYLFAVIIGVTPMFKVYAGIILFAGLITVTAGELLHKNIRVLYPLFLSVIIGFLTYGVFSGSGNYLIYLPLWATHRMLEWNLPWYGFEEKYYTYTKLSVIRGLLEVETYGLFLFLIGNLGTRVFGVVIHAIQFLWKRKPLSIFGGTLFVMTATSIFLPLFFIQSVKVFEMIQMSWYYVFLVAIAAAPGLGKLPFIPTLAIIIMTLPSTYTSIGEKLPFVHREPLAQFSPYVFLGGQGSYDDTVLELPPAGVATKEDIVKWYHSTEPTIPAFANKRSFFVDSSKIIFPNLDIDGRAAFIAEVQTLLTEEKKDSKNSNFQNQQIIDALKSRGIVYLYSPYRLDVLEKFSQDPVFTGNSIYIYKID